MQQIDLDAIAQRLAEALRCDHETLCLQLVKLLANGCPVSREQLVEALHVTHKELQAALACLSDAEFDQKGNIVGWGLTLNPTPHRFIVNGQTLFTWCALDALTYPALLKFPAHVESRCPITGAKVTLSVMLTGIENLVPSNAVVSLIIPESSQASDCDRETFCNQGYFFISPETASVWQASHQNALILSIHNAYQLGQMVAKYRYKELRENVRTVFP
jgi:alkylmercury lyase